MTLVRHHTGERMSRTVIHNSTVYLCGQVAEDRTQGIAEQTRTMLAKVDALLAEVGSDRQYLLSATIYVKDMSLFDEMSQVWDTWVPAGHAPARVKAAMASPDC